MALVPTPGKERASTIEAVIRAPPVANADPLGIAISIIARLFAPTGRVFLA